MDYQETLEYLFGRLPMFQRIGAAAYKADLSTTIALADLTGNPEKELKFVHIAGTNGKGSVSNMCASILQEAGYETGLFTSPHLKDFRERIRHNGQKIPREAVIDFVANYRHAWEPLEPSFFEITFAMAMWYFKEIGVEIVVLETGMGGRLDSTNIVRPEVSVITSIGLDHTQFLGDTIERIAAEKAGIIKLGIPVVVGDLRTEAMQVIKDKAGSSASALYAIREHTIGVPVLDLKGPFQEDNARICILTMRVLQEKGWKVQAEHVVRGLGNVSENTGFAGRWQMLSTSPLTIADCGHNYDGLQMTMQELKNIQKEKLHIVIGMSSDKDITPILRLFPNDALYYFCAADIPRALSPEDLQEKAGAEGLHGEAFESVRKAYEAARIYADKSDLIFIGGSVFVVAEVV
ncbi:MAG: bifunctional folylpolyglutamate synthase/dihydrofolate synthase [Cryomorphaceae bacterium]|nr:bifunctional folylpolyglutamate synthase/dihydrofolate synthase [Cryomorphaceae bacterium]